MKRLLLLISAIFLLHYLCYAEVTFNESTCSSINGATLSSWNGVASSGGSCALVSSQTTDNDYWASGTLCQKIKYSTTKEVCQVDILALDGGGTSVIHMYASSAADGSAQIGASSTTAAIISGTATWYTVTWTTGPSPTADWYLCRAWDTVGAMRWEASADSASYEDTNYDSIQNGTDINGDFAFRLYQK